MKPFVTLLVVGLAICAVAYFVSRSNACERRGGVMVRDVVGFTCVKAAP